MAGVPGSAEQMETDMDNLDITSTPPLTTLQDLKDNSQLWYKIHVFVYDLRNFREIPEAQKRLDGIVDASYIGVPYFTEDEVAILKSTAIDGDKSLAMLIEETLNERLERRMKKRVESGDYRVCAAHDLAPIFEQAFGIKPKDLAKDVDFLDILEQSRLKLKTGQVWKGVSKKAFQKKNKHKKH